MKIQNYLKTSLGMVVATQPGLDMFQEADLAQVDFFATLPIPKPVTSVGPYDVKVVYRQIPA